MFLSMKLTQACTGPRGSSTHYCPPAKTMFAQANIGLLWVGAKHSPSIHAWDTTITSAQAGQQVYEVTASISYTSLTTRTTTHTHQSLGQHLWAPHRQRHIALVTHTLAPQSYHTSKSFLAICTNTTQNHVIKHTAPQVSFKPQTHFIPIQTTGPYVLSKATCLPIVILFITIINKTLKNPFNIYLISLLKMHLPHNTRISKD